MGKQDYEKLDIYSFGRQLIETRDLDPIYCMLWDAKLSQQLLRKWLLAYWSFYHAGTASWIVDQLDYWNAMGTAAASKDYFRASERRHFRGEFAVKAVILLSQQSVDDRFNNLTQGQPLTLQQVMKRVQEWYGFGSWISFKVADMLERLNICEVKFDSADTFLFDSPKDGAAMAADKEGVITNNAPEWAMKMLKRKLGTILAPPRYERRFGPSEAETTLCKIKSHWEGKYWVGKDITEIRHGLQKYSLKSLTARRLLRSVPLEVK